MAALVTVFALAACSKGPKEPEAPPAAPHLRLMTTEQYLNTLGYIFGPSVTMEMKFAPLQRDNGLLANDAAVAGVTGA